MAKQPGAAVGIDIGTKFIKIAEIRAGRPPVLTSVGMAPTPEGAVDPGGIIDYAAVAAVIKRLIAESGISTKQAVLSLAGQNAVVVRIPEVPKMSANELRQHMDWEIQRNIPFADTRVQSDYQVINRPNADPNDQNMEVVLAVAQQDAIDGLVSIADGAGLEPYGIDVEPLALGRSLLLSQEAMRTKNVVIVNFGANSTSVDIYDQGFLSFPRILPLGGESLTRAIAERLMVSDEEAERIKVQDAEVILGQVAQPFSPPTAGFGGYDTGTTVPPTPYDPSATSADPGGYGAPPAEELGTGPDIPPSPWDQPQTAPEPPPAAVPAPSSESMVRKQQVFQAMYPVLDELASELRRSLEYYRSRHADTQIDLIVLCGGSAVIPNLTEMIKNSVGVPTVLANPLSGLQVNVKRHGPDYVVANAHIFPIAIGMALHPLF